MCVFFNFKCTSSLPSDSYVDSDSDSDSSSDSDSDSDVEHPTHPSASTSKQQEPLDHADADDEDEDAPSQAPTGTHIMTQNEVAEAEIMIPQISEVGPHEVLEPVGEVMSIVNNVVIVKGTASGTVRANEKALDSDTLLVFEDRQVLGYVRNHVFCRVYTLNR